MRITRCHIDAPLAVGDTIDLPEALANHVVRVLRLGVDARIVLFNGDGHDYPAQLVELGKRSAKAQVLTCEPVPSESPLRITLVQALARGDKMDLILQKAVELGVHALQPLLTERTEVKLDAERSEKRHAHWRGVITAACEQCGRARVPELAPVATLADWASTRPAGLLLALDPEAEMRLGDLQPDALNTEAGVLLLVGPEGGLSDRDLTQARLIGARGLQLGPRVLRTETAGLAAISALQARFGDFA